ncbi:MAG: FAD-binding oxidoreductase, partial [Pedobacter sp.]
LLVGSENGSTLGFANHVHNQLQSNGKKSYLTDMNNFSEFPKAKKLVVFTSTYGLGEAPSNATKFEKLLSQFPQKQKIDFSVVGFGSKSYPDFCAFAIYVDELLSQQVWANRGLSLHTVNDKSPEEFTQWVADWSNLNELAMATTPSLYAQQLPKLAKFTVIDKAEIVCDQITTFRINLKPSSLQKFKSGDLLAIYPLNNSVERFYSIGKVNKSIQLIVRLHPMGLGSGFLHDLKKGKTIRARIIKNPQFYFPKNANQVALISNGTGIAPFLGMLDENKHHVETHLYAGFRRLNALTKRYLEITDEFKKDSKLQTFNLAISREEVPQYVMNLIERDQDFFFKLLQKNGVIMICGSLKMQKDVEIILSAICKNNNDDYARFKANGQILTDCY